MPACRNLQHGIVAQFGPAVLPRDRHLRQGGENVECGQNLGGLQQTPGLCGHALAQRHKQVVFARVDFFLRGQDLFLILFQLGRNVALRILERLLALVVRGDFGGVCVRDLDVVAEHLIETDFQARDAGTRDLLRLKPGDPFLAAPGDGVQLI